MSNNWSTNFTNALTVVLNHEGGYTDDPNDSGGPTNYGITQAELSAWLKRPASISDVQSMTVSTAGEIYKSNYWDALALDQVENSYLSTIIFDQGVNRGIDAIAKDVQRLVGVTVDGDFGPQTLAAINAATATSLGIKIIEVSQQHYISFCLNDDTQLGFLMGWIARTQSLLNYMFGLPWQL